MPSKSAESSKVAKKKLARPIPSQPSFTPSEHRLLELGAGRVERGEAAQPAQVEHAVDHGVAEDERRRTRSRGS